MKGLKWKLSIKFEPRDIWVGVFWDKKPKSVHEKLRLWDVYVCLIPLLPIRAFQYIPHDGLEE